MGMRQRRWLLVALYGVFALGTNAAAATPEEYQQCLENCEAQFVPVADSDGGCARTLAHLHKDFGLLVNIFADPDACRGRNAAACNEFKGYAQASLEKLVAYTTETGDCMAYDASAMLEEAWLFDPIKACKGDGAFTDLHDFLGAKRDLLDKYNALAPHYTYSREMFDPYDDYGGHRPECPPGARPSQSYIQPMFRIYRSLESLVDYQACMPNCKAPSEQEKRLFELQARIAQIRDAFAAFEQVFNAMVEARSRRLMDRYGFTFPCTAFQKQLKIIGPGRDTLDRFDATIDSLLAEPDREATRLDDLEQEAAELEDAVREGRAAELAAACEDEDARAAALMERKRALVDRILRGETFCIDAAKTFVGLSGEGASCTWTGECNIPLRCVEGTCKGGVSVDEVRPVLREAKGLAEQAVQLAIHDATGLNEKASDRLLALEEAVNAAQQELSAVGWQKAVDAWRTDYTAGLQDHLQSLQADLKETLAAHDSGLSPACADVVKDVDAAAEQVAGIIQALGNADPVARARWVRLKTRDTQALRDEFEKLRKDLTDACAAPEDPETGWLLWVIVAGALLVAGAAAILLGYRRKRTRRRRV